MTNDAPTIFALASGAGKSGVSVFRISGPKAKETLRLCASASIPPPRKASFREIVNPQTKETIDKALVLFFPGPDSYTGEDVVELHTHGGRAVMNAVTEALQSLSGFRLAEPGEFTRRAFENGKMDLTEAEAVADLVNAETEAQRKQALRQMEGLLGQLYNGWRERLSRALAYIEGAIDFSDEELPQSLIDAQSDELRRLREEITAHLNDNRRGERLRTGFSIVLLGPPNAGKSSLLNALARREAAIVSPTAGTTRDLIDVHLDIGGYPVTLTDTAGLRELAGESHAHDAIENEGIRRAKAQAEKADLKIVIFDGAAWPQADEAAKAQIDGDTIVIVNKADLLESIQHSASGIQGKKESPSPLMGEGGVGVTSIPRIPNPESRIPLFLSALTGQGIETLLEKLLKEIDRRYAASSAPPLTRARHRAALEESASHLDRALQAPQTDMRAEDVRLAMRALGRITGRVDVEDLLDIIFRDFCIGK